MLKLEQKNRNKRKPHDPVIYTHYTASCGLEPLERVPLTASWGRIRALTRHLRVSARFSRTLTRPFKDFKGLIKALKLLY